jgi:hypothetical protein
MLLADAKPVHARWSEVNREFLGFVERNPDCLERANYASIYHDDLMRIYPIQPWPLFVGDEQRRRMGEITVGMDRLVKGTLERFLGNDPAAIAAYYHSTVTMDGSPSDAYNVDEDMLALFLEEPNGIWNGPSRGDYIETAAGLQCIEFNAGRCLGGMQITDVGEAYLGCEPTARFLREHDRRVRPQGVLGALLRHVVEDTVRFGSWTGGDFNVAVAVRPHDATWVSRHDEEVWTRELRRVLAERGGTPSGGRVLVCGLDDLEEDGMGLAVRGYPVHAVLDRHDGSGDVRRLFRAFKMEAVNLFGGPLGVLVGDKRTLALLSEHAGSDELTAAERALLEGHLPWTRRVMESRTVTPFRGRTLRLPDDLLEYREDLVLKKGVSLGGACVEVGKYRTPDEWSEAVARAVREEDWIVQEHLVTVPYWFQSGDVGAARHEVVWGLFAFGDHFGGAFLRMQSTAGRGVVNAVQGAEIGAMLDVVE